MIYEIKTYDLTDKKISLFKERPDLKEIKGEHGQRDRFVDADGVDANFGPRTKLTANLGATLNCLSEDNFPTFLPYFADVTQDIHSKFKFEPETYKSCQLMTETHGGYLQFFDHKTEKVLRIAINSNIYTPVK